MQSINVHEAKTHLSRLLDDAAAGKEIIIAKSGKPIAMLVSIHKRAARRKGLLKGRVRIGKAFADPLPKEVVEGFEKGALR